MGTDEFKILENLFQNIETSYNSEIEECFRKTPKDFHAYFQQKTKSINCQSVFRWLEILDIDYIYKMYQNEDKNEIRHILREQKNNWKIDSNMQLEDERQNNIEEYEDLKEFDEKWDKITEVVNSKPMYF